MKRFVFFAIIFNFSLFATADEAIVEKDLQTGCCIFNVQQKNKCAPATLGYCRRKAEQSNIDFIFKKDTKCSIVPACPKQITLEEQ